MTPKQGTTQAPKWGTPARGGKLADKTPQAPVAPEHVPEENFPEEVSPMALRKGSQFLADIEAGTLEVEENDFVILAKGVYDTLGVPTNTNTGSRKIASTPGRMTWSRDVDGWGQHPSGRLLGVKCFLMLSKPISAQAGQEEGEETDGPRMSAML